MRTILSAFLVVSCCAGLALAGPGDRSPIEPPRAAHLDVETIAATLANAPMEGKRAAGVDDVVLTLPMPDGTDRRFRVEESPILSAQDAQRFPRFRSFRVRGVDDPSWTGRINLLDHGFSGLIVTDRGIVRLSRSPGGSASEFESAFAEEGLTECSSESASSGGGGGGGGVPFCWQGDPDFLSPSQTVIRTHTVAFAARKDYTDYILNNTNGEGDVDGNLVINDDDVLASLVIEAADLNAIFERELSIRVSPIMDYDLVFKSHTPVGSACEPISAPCVVSGSDTLNRIGCVFEELRESGQIVDFDLGHLLGAVPPNQGCRSAAFVGSVCDESAGNLRKAKALTARKNKVKTLAHEAGHQLGASHTFSYKNDALGCTEYSSGSGFEPGSGSTLMSYAGCGGTNAVQGYADDYYHIFSIEDMLGTLQNNCAQPVCPAGDYCPNPPSGGRMCLAVDTRNPMCIPDGGAPVFCGEGETVVEATCDCNGGSGASWYCAPSSNPANRAPVVWGGGDFSVPPETPFTLTATADDPDSDPGLTFNWEQFNKNCPPSSALVDDPGPDPLFRSIYPAPATPFGSLSRSFVDIGQAGHILPTLPTVDENWDPIEDEQPIQMRLVVRDGVGGIGTAMTRIDVAGDEAFEVVVDPASPGQLTRVSWNYLDPYATVEVTFVEGGTLNATTLAGPYLPNDGHVYVDVPVACGTDDHRMNVKVTQVEPLAEVATATFSGTTLFNVYCFCPPLGDCSPCFEDRLGGECTWQTLGQDGCFLDNDTLAFCPTGNFGLKNCPCTYPGPPPHPACPSESGGLTCSCQDSDCADPSFCNGAETCEITGCEPGPSPCPPGLCDELGDQCWSCAQVGDCDDNLFCNGSETCDDATGCADGTPPCDSVPEPCNEFFDECLSECPSGDFCATPPSGPTCNPQDLGVDRCAKSTITQCPAGQTIHVASCPCEGGIGSASSWYCE